MESSVMNAAIGSLLRYALTVAGTLLASKGIVSADLLNSAVGAAGVAIPAIWGVWQKFTAEKKAKAREVVAAQATVSAIQNPASPVTATTPLTKETVPVIIDQYKGAVPVGVNPAAVTNTPMPAPVSSSD